MKHGDILQVLLLLAVLFLALVVNNELPSEAEIEHKQHLTYCEMVRLHNADPTIGWPDYKHIYDKECDE